MGKAIIWLFLEGEGFDQAAGDFEEACLGQVRETDVSRARFRFWSMLLKFLPGSRIVLLLPEDFALWVLANLVAWPIVYLAMNKWLQNFACRVDISVWTFALSALIALLIVLVTVNCQAVKAVLLTQVYSLRSE